MAYDYDTLYGTTPHALGEPTQAIVDFFARLEGAPLRILDAGCGQGRDALFLARMGHRVLGVDMSPNGIRDLVETAIREGSAIEGVVADLVSFVPDGTFDVVLCDRTLHMLTENERLDVLTRLIGYVREGGWLLIADERRNMAGFKSVLETSAFSWTPQLNKRGYLFVRRA